MRIVWTLSYTYILYNVTHSETRHWSSSGNYNNTRVCPFSTYRMSTISHQPQWHHTELQLCRWYVPIGTRLRSMHQTIRKHLSGRIPAGAWLHIWYQLNGRSVIVNRNYSEFKQYNIVSVSSSHSFQFLTVLWHFFPV